jgi:hypothetical protein
MKAIAKPFPTSLLVLLNDAVMAITSDISTVMMMPVIQSVFFLTQLSTKYKQTTFVMGPTIP